MTLRQSARGFDERSIHFATQGRDRADADDDDQGEHDGVFNSRWTIF